MSTARNLRSLSLLWLSAFTRSSKPREGSSRTWQATVLSNNKQRVWGVCVRGIRNSWEVGYVCLLLSYLSKANPCVFMKYCLGLLLQAHKTLSGCYYQFFLQMETTMLDPKCSDSQKSPF